MRCDRVDLAIAEDASKCGHLRKACLVMIRLTDTVRESQVDGIKIAAPQPVIVIEVGISF